MKKIIAILVLVVTIMIGSAIVWFWPSKEEIAPIVVSQIVPPAPKGPNAQTIVAVSLKAVKRQNKIVPMEAHYVAVVTSDETRLGIFHSRKTLVMPGRFRYEVDLQKLRQEDLSWDGDAKVLRVHLPKVEVSGPEVDLSKMKNYADGMLTSFASVGDALDERNRIAARKELINQANNSNAIRVAQSAAARAIEQTFQMPMRAAGLNCTVEVSF